MRGIIATGVLFGLTATAHAQLELKNDGFDSGDAVNFQAGFCQSEIAAVRLVAPDAGRQLLKVRLLFGGGGTSQDITLHVWDDSAGTDTPGAELHTADFTLVNSNDSFQEMDITAAGVFVTQQFRIGIEYHTNMLTPGVCADTDGLAAPTRNFIYAATSCGPPASIWFPSGTLGVSGDWVIRADVSGGGSGTPDAAPGTPDGAPGTPDAATGGGCNGNTECSVGQYCDTANHVCTFDCIEDTDCGGSMACSSLGQCVEGSGGGGCQTDPRSGPGGLVVLCALGVLTLVVRRRPR